MNFPKDVNDLKGTLKELVDVEGCAIDVYVKLLKKLSPCHEKNAKTFHVVEHMLSEEIAYEEIESLL